MYVSPLHDRMVASLADFEACGDRKSIFLDCYLRMTRNMLAGLGAGEFEDRIWVNHLLERFGEYYFAGLDAYRQSPESAPPVWRIAHRATDFPEIGPMRLLLLGVNAHINYDLVMAITDVLCDEWPNCSQDQKASRQRDHNRVNQVIGDTIDEVQDEVLEPEQEGLAFLDLIMGRLDEWLISRLISNWRREVWNHAGQWLDAAPPDREAVMVMVEQEALKKADRILGKYSEIIGR